MQATVCEKTIAYGNQRWRIDLSGNWSVLMWGWWPDSNDQPSWRWQNIDTSKVPKDVKKGAL